MKSSLAVEDIFSPVAQRNKYSDHEKSSFDRESITMCKKTTLRIDTAGPRISLADLKTSASAYETPPTKREPSCEDGVMQA